jgi:hypothetical protein
VTVRQGLTGSGLGLAAGADPRHGPYLHHDAVALVDDAGDTAAADGLVGGYDCVDCGDGSLGARDMRLDPGLQRPPFGQARFDGVAIAARRPHFATRFRSAGALGRLSKIIVMAILAAAGGTPLLPPIRCCGGLAFTTKRLLPRANPAHGTLHRGKQKRRCLRDGECVHASSQIYF